MVEMRGDGADANPWKQTRHVSPYPCDVALNGIYATHKEERHDAHGGTGCRPYVVEKYLASRHLLWQPLHNTMREAAVGYMHTHTVGEETAQQFLVDSTIITI